MCVCALSVQLGLYRLRKASNFKRFHAIFKLKYRPLYKHVVTMKPVCPRNNPPRLISKIA